MDIKELNKIIEQLENQEDRDLTKERALHIYKQKRNDYYTKLIEEVQIS